MELNLKRQLIPFEWLQMSQEVRNLFIKWFNVPRTGGAIVIGGSVQSDGHTIEDLSAVSLASLQTFLHTDETHWDKLLQDTINKMENYIDGNPDDTTTENSATSSRTDEGTISKTSRVKKAKKTD